jgi:hypothetical protein
MSPIKDEKEYENEAYAKSSRILAHHLDTADGINDKSMSILYSTFNENLTPLEEQHVEKF